MSTTTRRKSHNSIQKTARLRSKKSKHSSKRDKRSSTNSIRSHSPQYRPHHRYSHHGIQPQSISHPIDSHNHNNNDESYPSIYDDVDVDDSPPVRPTHKKNAVSSFLSIFSTFSQSKTRRCDSNQSENSQTDLELLKKMKRRILDILSKMLEHKRLKKIKSELKSQVWEIEYKELKSRLSKHDIHTATIKQKLASAKSLKQLSSLQNNDKDDIENDEDIREMATFLLQEYFDQPNTNGHTSTTTTIPLKNTHITQSQTDIDEYEYNSDESYDDTQDIQEDKEKDYMYYNNKGNNGSGNKLIRINVKKSHKYSPRPIASTSPLSSPSSPTPNDVNVKVFNINDEDEKSDKTEMRIKINKNKNGKNKKRISLSLSDINLIESTRDMRDIRESPSYSGSSPFNNIMSDNLVVALSKVGTWEFDPFEFFECNEIGGQGLVYSVWYLFDKYNLFNIFPLIQPKKFMKFLHAVENGYLDNPYHNKIHATDVVSNVSYYLNNTAFFNKHISPFDKFTAILSAAVHDLGHDGNNNAYHITTMSDLAITYNDISVLENYHIAYTFKILKKSQCNWFKTLSKPVQRYLRLAMIDIVLATDMKFHNRKLAQLTNLVAILKQQLKKKVDKLNTNLSNNISNNRDSIVSSTSTVSIPMSPFVPNNSNKIPNLYNISNKLLSDFPLYKYKVNEVGVEHLLSTEINDIIINDSDPRVIDVNDERRFILCFLVHLCDISNCAKSLKSGKKWAVRVMTEFFKQGDRERALGLEVSAMMDRRRSSTPQGQIGFIKFILRPSYNMFVRLVPEASKPLEILNQNLEFWEIQQKLMTQERKKRARSVGSLAQNPVLMLMQQQLKKEYTNRIENIIENENETEAFENENETEFDDNESVVIKRQSNKHVGFKQQLVIETPQVESDKDENDSEIMVETPRTLSSKSLNIGMSSGPTKLKQSLSHHTNDASGSTHSSRMSRNTNISIDSLDSDRPTSTKLRAHSIHVSIPTSEKQIQSQPQPFSEFLAELRKEWENKEDEKYERDQNRKKRRERTIILMKTNNGKLLNTNNNTNDGNQTPTPKPKPKVKQSVSENQNGTVVAQISGDLTKTNDNNNDTNSNNSNDKKQVVFDVV